MNYKEFIEELLKKIGFELMDSTLDGADIYQRGDDEIIIEFNKIA